MKALSVKQPWASAIIDGPKKIENRTWALNAGRLPLRVAIHAGLHIPSDEEIALVASLGYKRQTPFPRGHLIGMATIIACEPMRQPEPPWGFGPFMWRLEDRVAFETPIPCKGSLGIWEIPEGVLPDGI